MFIDCSSHFGPFGANLALVSPTVLKQHFRKVFAPFFSIFGPKFWPGGNVPPVTVPELLKTTFS